jgi:hypothetical protein
VVGEIVRVRTVPAEPRRGFVACLGLQLSGLALGMSTLFVAVPHSLPWSARLAATLVWFGAISLGTLRVLGRIRLGAVVAAQPGS